MYLGLMRKKETIPKTHHCKVCNQEFKVKSEYIEHKRSHVAEKPFSCDVCGKSFKTEQNLTTHSRIHTGKINDLNMLKTQSTS